MEHTTFRNTESIGKDASKLFAWQQEAQPVPYYKQGNKRFESEAMISQRFELKHSAEVREAINKFWALMKKNPEGRVEKPAYTELCLRFSKLLLSDFSRAESLAVIEEDWENDSQGASSLSYSQFYEAVFQLADIWTEDINAENYADFLNKMFRRITMKKVIDDEGHVTLVHPSIKLVFPDEAHLEERWEEVKEEESFDDDFDYNFIEEDGVNKRFKKLKGPEVRTEDAILYDEVVGSDWDLPEEDEEIELAPLDDVIPLGQVARDYIANLQEESKEKDKASKRIEESKHEDRNKDTGLLKKQEIQKTESASKEETAKAKEVGNEESAKAKEVGKEETSKAEDIGKKTEAAKVEEPSKKEEVFKKQDSARIIPQKTQFQPSLTQEREDPKKDMRKTFVEKTNLHQPRTAEYNPLSHFTGEFLDALKQKTSDHITVISDRTKKRLAQKLQTSTQVEVKRAHIKKSGTNQAAAFLGSLAKPIFDFSLHSIKGAEGGISVDSQSKQEPSRTIQATRKNILEAKYASIIQRREKKTINYVKKGMILSDEEQRKRGFPIEEIKEEYYSEPLPAVNSLISKETALRKEQFSGSLDLVQKAGEDSVKILIIGKPRCGKSTLSDLLASSLDIINIELTAILTALIAKGAKSEEEEEEEVDEDNPPPEIYSEFEKEVIQTLENGQALNDEQIFALVKEALESDAAQSKGFVVDLPFNPNLIQLLSHFPFNLIVDLTLTDEDLAIQTEGMKYDPTTGKVYSRWDIAELLKPKVKTAEESDKEAEEEEEETPKLDQGALLRRAEDNPTFISEQAKEFDYRIRPIFLDQMKQLPVSAKLTLHAAGLSPEDRKAAILAKLGYRVKKIPAAKKLEGEAEPKALLLQEVEDAQEPRDWSLWKLIDPVALSQGKLVEGKPEFATAFGGRVFVFDDEKNQDFFTQHPQKFINKPPSLPEEFRVAIIGPRHAGKRTQAEYLAVKYHWKLLDINEIFNQCLTTQRKNSKDPKPSNPEIGVIQPSAEEFAKLLAGEGLPSKLIVPIVMHKCGVPLMKKLPRPPTPKSGDEAAAEDEPKEEESEKGKEKNKEEEKSEGSQDEEEKKESSAKEESVQEIVYEDIILEEIALADSQAETKGFIMVGFPQTEEEVALLKEFNIGFDKILNLVDPTEGQELKNRGIESVSNLQLELDLAEKSVAVCKEAFGEEIIVDIPITGSEQTVHTEIVKKIDPFCSGFDDGEVYIAKDDIGEERVPIPLGEYAQYDPIVYKDESWLMLGNEEFEVIYSGKRYTFAGEKELEQFKGSVTSYVSYEPLEVPPPHVMVLGVRGSGVNSVLQKLSSSYKISKIDLKKEMLEKLNSDMMARRKDRWLRRGFVPRPEEESDEPFDPLLNDPEITEEDENFDKATVDLQTVASLLPGKQPLLINGRWFEVTDEQVSLPIVDLLFESRRLPEIVIMLRASEQSVMNRVLDEQAIIDEYSRLVEERRLEKIRQKEEARREKIEAGEEVEDEEEEEEDEDDPDAPNLENMMEEAKQKIVEMREADNAAIEELKESFESRGISVIMVNADQPLARIYQRVDYELKPYLLGRDNMLESKLSITLTSEKAAEILDKHKAFQSVFLDQSPITANTLPAVNEYPVLYRDKVYFPKSKEEREEFIKQPLKYTSAEVAPWDLTRRPYCAVIGNPLSGKSTLARALTDKLGLVRISLRGTIELLLSAETELSSRIRQQMGQGLAIDDELAVEAIVWRMGHADVLKNGCVLDRFPLTRPQALLLAQLGRLPNPIFFISCTTASSLKRRSAKFKHERSALKKLIKASHYRNQELIAWLQNTFENVRYISSEHSKWFVVDSAVEQVNSVFDAQGAYAVAKIKGTPVNIKYLGITKQEINDRLSRFLNYDPVEWKFHEELEEVGHNDYVVEYQTRFYKFSTEENMLAFLGAPNKFLDSRGLPPHRPRKFLPNEVGEIAHDKLEINGNCPVTLTETKELKTGNPSVLASYINNIFAFTDIKQRRKFMKNPEKYVNAKLPLKLPPKPTHIPAELLGEFETSMGYLEQVLGEVIVKGMLEVGSEKLVYPTLSPQETALKHLSIYLKAHNPKNSKYLKDKYTRKLNEFKKHCALMEDVYSEGLKFDSLKSWQVKNFFKKSEEFTNLLKIIENLKEKFLVSFIR